MIIHNENGEIIVMNEASFNTLSERHKGHAAMLGGSVRRGMALEDQPMNSITEASIEVLPAREYIGSLALVRTGPEA